MLACLLLYSDEALVAAMPEVTAILRGAGLPPAELDAVLRFCDGLAAAELLDAQGEYVALFDGAPSLSLYLFGHVHGDSRERGQAVLWAAWISLFLLSYPQTDFTVQTVRGPATSHLGLPVWLATGLLCMLGMAFACGRASTSSTSATTSPRTWASFRASSGWPAGWAASCCLSCSASPSTGSG